MRNSPRRTHHPRWPAWGRRALPLATILTLIMSLGSSGVVHSTPMVEVAAGHGAANVDTRTSINPGERPTADQVRDLRTLPSPRLQWDDQWGEPSSLISDTGYLTGPSQASPVAIARQFLHDHAQLFGLSIRDLANLVVAKEYLTRHNGVTQLTLQQRDSGRDVYGALATFATDRNGRILIVGGHWT